MPNSDVQRPNDGPSDFVPYPPKWAFEPITDEEYAIAKIRHEARRLSDLCPITDEHCDDEMCGPGAECNLTPDSNIKEK
jgi:hypothetical protein